VNRHLGKRMMPASVPHLLFKKREDGIAGVTRAFGSDAEIVVDAQCFNSTGLQQSLRPVLHACCNGEKRPEMLRPETA
jgi:hypothetical protein